LEIRQLRSATTIAVATGLLLGQCCGVHAVAATPNVQPDAKPLTPPLRGLIPPATQPISQPTGKPLVPKTAPVMPPVAPPIKKQPVEPAATAPAKPIGAELAAENSAQVSELERLMFGEPQPKIPIEYRLDRLESEVFHSTNPDWDISRRIDRLNQTLVGSGGATTPTAPLPYPPDNNPYPTAAGAPYPPGSATPYQGNDPSGQPGLPYNQQAGNYPTPNYSQEPLPQKPAVSMPPPPNVDTPEFQNELPKPEAEKYALDRVNQMRTHNGLPGLLWDDTAHKVAEQHVSDLCNRNTVSHHNAAGENPDMRYTKAGGTDALLESIVSLKANGNVRFNKAIVAKIIEEQIRSQDDRDAMLSPHATRFAFSFSNTQKADRLIACTEIVTDQAELESIPNEVKVGDKVEIKGVIKGPYKFLKITLAWEGISANGDISAAEEQDEALPYFPPLDYTAFAKRSEHDWDKAIRLAQLGGIGIALAGGLFFPPVALAAPLIAASGSNMKPKAVSDIPIKGGVKISGNAFEHKAVISKDNKEGIYYITVWVQADSDPTPIAISRRAIIAHGQDGNDISKNSLKTGELLTVIEKEKTDDKKKGSNDTK